MIRTLQGIVNGVRRNHRDPDADAAGGQRTDLVDQRLGQLLRVRNGGVRQQDSELVTADPRDDIGEA